MVVPSVSNDPPQLLTRHVQVHESSEPTRYHVTAYAALSMCRGSLLDRGANGGILGNDAVVTHVHTGRTLDVSGIDNHELTGLKLVNATAKVHSDMGDIIIIMNQYACHGTLRTIHAVGQIEYHGNEVNDKSLKVKGGRQYIRTYDGYIIPVDIINGLPYIKMVPNTTEEWDRLPHTVLTKDMPWDPSVLDCRLTDNPEWYNTIQDLDNGLIQTPFDEYGNYRRREPVLAVESNAHDHTTDETRDDSNDDTRDDTPTKLPAYPDENCEDYFTSDRVQLQAAFHDLTVGINERGRGRRQLGGRGRTHPGRGRSGR